MGGQVLYHVLSCEHEAAMTEWQAAPEKPPSTCCKTSDPASVTIQMYFWDQVVIRRLPRFYALRQVATEDLIVVVAKRSGVSNKAENGTNFSCEPDSLGQSTCAWDRIWQGSVL